MLKNLLFFLTFLFTAINTFAQLNSTGHRIIDNHSKLTYQFNSSKRSVQNPTSCDRDTVEYGRYKGTGFFTVSVSKGRGLGQLYSAPKPLTLYGFTFYAFIASPPTKKKMNLICNVYKAGADSLPKGTPLRSDTITIDSTFGGGVLTKIEKHATFVPIILDSAYILTVETDSATLNAGVVTNSYSNGDGKKENLNCGSISGQWYNGKNLNIGGVSFNADILLHPHVSYSFGTDFTIKNPCYSLADTVKFINQAGKNMVGSKMYNRYLLYNLGYYCNWWNAGNSFGYTYSVDHKMKYNSRQNYQVQLISTIYGYRGMEYGCSDTTIKWLYYKPDVPQIGGPVNACIGDTIIYNVNNVDTGTVYEWYKKTSDVSPFYSGKSYKKTNVRTDTFYVRGNNHGCLTAFKTVILNVNAYPSTLTFKNDSICSGSKANLKGFTNIGNLEWFASANSIPVLYTGAVFQTPALTSDTFFFLQANNKGCIKSPRLKVRALVGSGFAPTAPVISKDTTICIASTSSLKLNATAGSGLTIRWFNVPSGGSSFATGTSYTFVPSIREVRTFYADAYNGICGSTRESVTITVEDYPKVSKILSDTICKGDSLIMFVFIPYGEAHWMDAPTGGNLLLDGTRYVVAAATTKNYYVETSSGICKSTSRNVVAGIVNTYPTVVKLWGDTICAKNRATLKSKLIGAGTIHWFEFDTSAVELGIGKTYTSPVLNGAKSFYGQPEYAGCYGPKQIVTPLVKPSPFSGYTYEVLSNQIVKVSPLNANGCNIQWDFGDGVKSNLSAVNHKYINPGVYQLKLILTDRITGCKDSTTYTITVTLSGIKVNSFVTGIKLYPNPAQQFLNIELQDHPSFVQIHIYGMDGMLIQTENALVENGKALLPIDKLSTGLYLLKVNDYPALLFVKD